MTELLPIIFTRGQNESIDPRVAPPDVHAIARNVRWRKDGRPAKRYGVAAVTTSGLAANGYNAQPVNALTQWGSTPVVAIGSTVRQLGPLGWNAQVMADAGDISHFAPLVRDVVTRDEQTTINNVTSGFCKGLVLHAWDNGSATFYAVKNREGTTVVAPKVLGLGSGTYPRCISTDNFIYIAVRNGAAIDLYTFDPLSLLVTGPIPAGALGSSASFFDAVGRGSDFVIASQSAAATLTVSLFSAIASPALLSTQSAGIVGSPCRIGVTSAAGAAVFVGVVEPAGAVKFAAYNTGVTALLGGGLIETDANNNSQPGLVLEGPTTCEIFWGGFVLASESSYVRLCQITSVSFGATTPIGTYYGISQASKPFMGPAYPTLGAIDGSYLWVSTHNADNGNSKWNSQRAYLLLKCHMGNFLPLRRQMHVPNVVAGVEQFHLSDVVNLGAGFGYLTPLRNAIRFANSLVTAFGFDTVSFRSIYDGPRAAARDSVTAGRALQFSGGSLFELNGDTEETGFSNAPVIQSITQGSAGGIAPGVYIYRAVYEWLDAQGRRHRSATSDPFTYTAATNAVANVTVKLLVADAHSQTAFGGIPSRGRVTIHIYRSLAGQATLHRVTPNVGAPNALIVGTASITFFDTMSDATAGGQEFLYTEGGVVDNTLCPPHTFQTVCNGRVWVGGQLDRCVVTASKLLVDGEPTQFSDLDPFNIFLPTDNTGIASLDGTTVLFSADRIYLVGGDGPNDQGVGDFSTPSELPTDVGCIDWRSVLETSAGVFFQSKRGIFLLPRGFASPVFVGAEVEATLAQFPIVVSATLVTMPSSGVNSLGEVTARFVVCTDEAQLTGAVLVYDLRTGGWSVDEFGNGPKLGGTWGAAFVTAREDLSGALVLHTENAGAGYVSPFGDHMITQLGTGDIRPFGIAGYGGFESVVLMGEFRGPALVNIQVIVDGGPPDLFQFHVTAPDGPSDNTVYLDVTPRVRLGSAIRVLCQDSRETIPSEGFIMQALFIEHETIGKTKRLAAARRA